MKDKLVELLRKSGWVDEPEDVADFLLSHGVFVLPCKIGEKVFCIRHDKGEILEDVVEDYDIWSIKDGIKLRITLQNFNSYVIAEFGKTVFLTREEAEAAFTERK